MKRTLAVSAAAAALAGLLTAAGPAVAQTPGTASGASRCTPGPTVLPSLPPDARGGTSAEGVHDLGPRGLAVGASGGLPVYWRGERLHRVPLPEGYDEGVVRAVNRQGLMAGWVGRRSDGSTALFSYRPGAASVRLFAEGVARGASDVDVDDAGRIAAVDSDGTAKVWRGGKVTRILALPPDAGPGTVVTRITGVNARGDVIGAAEQSYDGPDGFTWSSFPVLWPGDGGPARALPVARAEYLVHNMAEGIDDAGQVVGYVSVSDRFDPEGEPWSWTPPTRITARPPASLPGSRRASSVRSARRRASRWVRRRPTGRTPRPSPPRPSCGQGTARSSRCRRSTRTATRRPAPCPTTTGSAESPLTRRGSPVR